MSSEVTGAETGTDTDDELNLNARGHARKITGCIGKMFGRLDNIESLFESLAGSDLSLAIVKNNGAVLPIHRVLGEQAYRNLVSLTWAKLDHERLHLMEFFEALQEQVQKIEKT